MVSKDLLKKSIGDIRKVTTLKIWVNRHGFNYNYVSDFLNGRGGKWQVGEGGKIIAALRKDGYLEGA